MSENFWGDFFTHTVYVTGDSAVSGNCTDIYNTNNVCTKCHFEYVTFADGISAKMQRCAQTNSKIFRVKIPWVRAQWRIRLGALIFGFIPYQKFTDPRNDPQHLPLGEMSRLYVVGPRNWSKALPTLLSLLGLLLSDFRSTKAFFHFTTDRH